MYFHTKANAVQSGRKLDFMRTKLLETAEKVGFNIDGRKMYSSPKTEIIHLDLKFGEVIEMHSNPFDVVFYILEGAGIIETPDEQITVEQDMCIEISAAEPRLIRNIGADSLRVLAVKIF
ncbi:Cupin domain-containing protein [Williamwhitmania taraxaci]|uniref:Cupin domain-containing protein n=2 Tax=Williamwhitmania taraxaci TaxID=1640674 RepID=A0A1G6GQU8_9BACT|nr:Cupin domain-containing protein [Williamwhitmania taraxaci]